MTQTLTGKLTLGQLCKRVGLARSSVLHYEFLRLLEPCGRSAAGYRLYGQAELQRLLTIRRLRDAGMALADIRLLLSALDSPGRSGQAQPAVLLEQRLLALCREVERIRVQQRLLARLLALPEFRDGRQTHDQGAWVALLQRAGFDESAMQAWHIEFERENPAAHAAFLESLGLEQSEANEIRRWSQAGSGVAAA